ncbi:beta-L-arabinofuranosidase domain-containing protein [Bifidobacterium oedipodis]|uniref:Tat pathway signal sequence domain-containing protein n=1 Tax=Bifidobacterium oedipodis TaxID=2675322 RepID=A0A7Y0EPM8_9BIFI|nr:beta-L-arabinofuranosidase domain-containing protein [Bifidobacterium sp. DSM 109957]NMM94124.1 Tat pathway signal sequence domain-containing protein [Bifidobacterium sp. DSM 109957]
MENRFASFPLTDVTLADGEFRRRQLLVRDYVLSFDLDRLMHTFRVNAGVSEPAGVEPLGGWEAPDCGLRGHFVGHFLSAASRFYAGCDAELEPQIKTQLHTIVDTIVSVMADCAQPSGYLSAFPESQLDTLESKEYRKIWAPYYTLHKIMQGLNDAYRYVGNETALKLAVNLAHYIAGRFAPLGHWKIDNMLRPTRLNPINEFGGIGEALYNLYDLTGDDKVLATAKIFDRDYFLGPVSQGEDVLEDLHGNTHLPQIIAAEHRYEITGEVKYRDAAVNFANMLATRTFANGSNSSKAKHYTLEYGVSDKAEHWGTAGDLHDALTFGESESCNGHNTERVVSTLLRWTGDKRYADWVARLKFNAILNCLNPRTGLSQYHQPMGVGARKIFSTPMNTFWCCTGTGVEGASDLQKDIWFRGVAGADNAGVGSADGLSSAKNSADSPAAASAADNGAAVSTVLLGSFIASAVDWREQGVRLELTTDYPASLTATLTVRLLPQSGACSESSRFALLLRGDTVADASVPMSHREDGYAVIERDWHDGDVVTFSIASNWHTETLQGAPARKAVLEGDVLMAMPGHAVDIDNLPDGGAALEEAVTVLKMRPLAAIGGDEEYSVYLNTDAAHPVQIEPFEPVAEGANDPQ